MITCFCSPDLWYFPQGTTDFITIASSLEQLRDAIEAVPQFGKVSVQFMNSQADDSTLDTICSNGGNKVSPMLTTFVISGVLNVANVVIKQNASK